MEFGGFIINYSDKEVSPHGGMILMQELLEKTGIKQSILDIGLPQIKSPNSHKSIDIVVSFSVSSWCGANKLLQTEHARYYEVLKKLFQLKKIPSHVTFGRFFKKFRWATNDNFFPQISQWYFLRIQIDRITLDFDSMEITRYGEQQGSKKGYNPKKKERASHHPLIAYISELRMIANGWLRIGNTTSFSSFENFFEETMRILEGKTIGLVRADSGFFSKSVMEMSGLKQMSYVISCRLVKSIQHIIYNTQKGNIIDKGIWISD
ncbi:MAG: hypothetical protein HOP11_05130 [Saprospiraceae bacterium]|nr:hypothetical protein [Saprospiraceae bacterium]